MANVADVIGDARRAVAIENRPAWMQSSDELPHAPPANEPLWNETYLTYAYSPDNQVGVYWHLRHVPNDGAPALWDVVNFVALPGDQYLVSKVVAPGVVHKNDEGVGWMEIAGLRWECQRPYDVWIKRYRGGARLVSGAELRAGPLADGPLIPVDIQIEIRATTPPWDHSTDAIKGEEIDWEVSKRHYEQHFDVTGQVSFNGETYPIIGKGLRDHSWGARNFLNMSHTTWIHTATDDGRAFSVTYVPGVNGGPTMFDPKVCSRTEVVYTDMRNPPLAHTVEEALADAEFSLTMPDGRETHVHVKMLNVFPMHMLAPSEFVLGWPGKDRQPTHIDVGGFALVEWDGKTYFGYRESCVRQIP